MAGSMQSWIEAVLLIVLTVGVMVLLITDMNELYGKNYQIEGLDTSSLQSQIEELSNSSAQQIRTGEVTFWGGLGMSLSTSWAVILSTAQLLWGFLSGNFINVIIVQYMGLPTIVAVVFRSLYFIAVMFLILKVVFRITV